MAASPEGVDVSVNGRRVSGMQLTRSQIFEQLKQPVDPKIIAEREEKLNERIHAQYEKSQLRQAEILGANGTSPVTISSIRVLGATNTRRGFLEHIFHPILSQNRKQPISSLSEALQDIGSAVDKLNRLDIFHTPISTYIDAAEPTNPSTTPTDHDVYISVRERGRYTIKTGTEAGSSEGSAYVNVALRNILGGAESLNASASLGTRTRTAYSAFVDTPILSNPDLKWEIGGLASSTLKPWASHEEVLKGGLTRLLWRASRYSKHEFAYNGFWRQITSLAEKASNGVRADAGDSFKSSLSHTWTVDTRDSPMLPTQGGLFKIASELAGVGPLQGDVAFGKCEVDSQVALPIPLPGLVKGDTGISLTAGVRGGLLYPLTLLEHSAPLPSRLNDRFQLGGPTDVRGFRLSGLGPHDGQDALGGDVYAAGGVSLLLPLPYVKKDTPLRLQGFVNAGRLLALKDVRTDKNKHLSSEDVGSAFVETVKEVGRELPSTTAGIGLVYAHPAARFELNFSLPLVLRQGEEGRKGISFGVGLSFL